jgi:hypothetical protein
VTTIKNEAYRKMQQKNHTFKAVEEYRVAQREEKMVKRGRKRIIMNQFLRILNTSEI